MDVTAYGPKMIPKRFAGGSLVAQTGSKMPQASVIHLRYEKEPTQEFHFHHAALVQPLRQMDKKRLTLGLGIAVVAAGFVVARGCLSSPQSGAGAGKNGSGAEAARDKPARPTGPAGPISIVVDAGPMEAGAEKGPDVFFSAKWGGGRMDELGHSRPSEANPEAPMSLTVDGQGRMYVLDQVNGRVLRVGADGKPLGVIPLKQQEAAQDIAIAKDGSVAVLDRYSSKSVVMYDQQGNPLGEIQLQGEGLEETGLATGLFVDGNDVYVEKEHGPLVRVGTTDGKPATDRGEIPGRPSRDGTIFINAGVIDVAAGRMYVSAIDRATMQHRFTRELRQGAAIHGILMLDSDKLGTIYLATQLDQNGSEVVILTCLEPLKGFPTGNVQLPVNTLPEETFRDFAVLDDGGVIYSVRTEQGVSYQRYDCP